ncbi:signal peptidase II [Metapseudomonas lalkuanensis]|uniref:Lipoprotein signal peptidase n=1 Tax=Metapseudomonas lalkuanensis TaxID=2604832 RepID=A0A5J6QPS5_9GAMM|nr:signal peptidase II [Pseudomonas lalkuanensis]QEY62746.1 signal peptidase II [Pseudomonas lalkuanensis]UCO96027.1 signal peptidase II [Pseudomonas lalkuanensis]
MDSRVWSKSGFLLVSLIVIVVDQLTKYMADASLEFGRAVAVLPFFDLQLSYNTGAAFGMLGDAGGWQRILFAAIALVVIAALLVWIIRQSNDRFIHVLGLALVLGGAAGNLIDRVVFGHVIDFVLLHWQGRGFPNFNFADVAINVGALMVLLGSLGSREAPAQG